VKKYDELKAKGVDVVAVVAANDAFVMSGWARVEGLKDRVCTFPSSLEKKGS
jgi:alkyl hydroperoxide reductase 1